MIYINKAHDPEKIWEYGFFRYLPVVQFISLDIGRLQRYPAAQRR
jgi:hypothetical protein